MARTLPAGIYRDRRGYRAVVRVRPLPAVQHRFPPSTTLTAMKTWRDETRARLLRRKRLQGGVAVGPLTGDVKRYLAQWGDVHPETRAQRERHLAMWVAAFPGRARTSLTPIEIRTQLIAWQQQHGYRPATLDKIRQALYQVFVALDRGSGEPNPVAQVPTFTQPNAWRQEAPRALPYDVIVRLLEELPCSKTRARLAVMAWTGLRPSEVMRIQPEDHQGASLVVRTAKGGPAAVVPLLPQAVKALEEFAAQQAYGPYARSAAARTWHRACVAIGLEADGEPYWRPYDLRHSFGTQFFRTTTDVKATKEIMRHSTLAMTERYVAAAVNPVLQHGLTAFGTGLPTHPAGRRESVGQVSHLRRVANAKRKGAS